MIWWLLGGLGLVVAAGRTKPPRTVHVPRGQSYRVLHEFDRISAREVQDIARNQSKWVLMEHRPKQAWAMFYADVAPSDDEDLIFTVPGIWGMVAGMALVDDNDTEARWRLFDVRLAVA